MTSALIEAMENEINQKRGVVKELHDQLEALQHRASAAEAEVARLRADLMSPFAVMEIDQAIDILEGLNDKCNIGEIDQHASPALGIAIDVLCKLIGIKPEKESAS